jgi:hypothetical protein
MTGWWFQNIWIIFHHIWDVILPIEILRDVTILVDSRVRSSSSFAICGIFCALPRSRPLEVLEVLEAKPLRCPLFPLLDS